MQYFRPSLSYHLSLTSLFYPFLSGRLKTGFTVGLIIDNIIENTYYLDKIKRSTNNSSTNNFVSRSVIKAGTLGIYQVVRDE